MTLAVDSMSVDEVLATQRNGGSVRVGAWLFVTSNDGSFLADVPEVDVEKSQRLRVDVPGLIYALEQSAPAVLGGTLLFRLWARLTVEVAIENDVPVIRNVLSGTLRDDAGDDWEFRVEKLSNPTARATQTTRPGDRDNEL